MGLQTRRWECLTMYDRNEAPAPSRLAASAPVRGAYGIPVTASRGPIILSGCSRLERLRYAAEQAILDWRDADPATRPAVLLSVRDKQMQISRAKFRNAQLASEMSARTWVDNWEPPR